MKIIFKMLIALAVTSFGFLPTTVEAEECFKHNIQLQVADSFGFPVPGTEFWVTLDIHKDGNKVTIEFPNINFQTGQFANDPYEQNAGIPPFVPGGYVYTATGFLPKSLRPRDIVYRSWVAASNNGLSLPFSFTDTPSTVPNPAPGYILSVTNAGAVVIQGNGSFENVIPPGSQSLLPTSVTYYVDPIIKLKKNTKISTGATNTTLFTGDLRIPGLANGFRDSHLNDAFDGVAAFSWSDNSMIADKTQLIINTMVAIGTKDKNGGLKVKAPIQLTDNTFGLSNFDTAVAINRTNKKNIVVSWGGIDYNTGATLAYSASSFDGGKTFPYNGPTNIQPSGGQGFGDCLGVQADKYGNIWYGLTYLFDPTGTYLINGPLFYASTDGGITYTQVFSAPAGDPIADFFYDFPQYCFGGDGQGNYGLQFVASYLNSVTNDSVPFVGFIPITGLGQFGTPEYAYLNSYPNSCSAAVVTASADGKVWYFGCPDVNTETLVVAGTYIVPFVNLFKSPGILTNNYAGPFDFAMVNAKNYFWEIFFSTVPPYAVQDSQPFVGYVLGSPRSSVYDDKRQALYGIVATPFPDNSQDMRLYFSISRDNGQTWSKVLDISNTDFANRGFQSMALDTVRGDLYFGFYDGRHDPTFASAEYYGAVIPAKELDKLVKKIPLSNPLYISPDATVPFMSGILQSSNANNQSGKASDIKAKSNRASKLREFKLNRFGKVKANANAKPKAKK